MEKNKDKVNTLIKRKNLALLIQKNGIKRVSPEAILELEIYAKHCIQDIIPLLVEELAMNGRNTLKKGDIIHVLEDIDNKNKQPSFEV